MKVDDFVLKFEPTVAWFVGHIERRKSFWFGSSFSVVDDLSDNARTWIAGLVKKPVEALPLK